MEAFAQSPLIRSLTMRKEKKGSKAEKVPDVGTKNNHNNNNSSGVLRVSPHHHSEFEICYIRVYTANWAPILLFARILFLHLSYLIYQN